jgi:hypothetical protein
MQPQMQPLQLRAVGSPVDRRCHSQSRMSELQHPEPVDRPDHHERVVESGTVCGTHQPDRGRARSSHFVEPVLQPWDLPKPAGQLPPENESTIRQPPRRRAGVMQLLNYRWVSCPLAVAAGVLGRVRKFGLTPFCLAGPVFDLSPLRYC